MNEKIKEILDDLKPKYDIVDELGNDYKKVKFKDCKLLLNYITNLQEENRLLKAKIKCMEEKINYKKAYKDESEIYNEFFR